MDTCACFENYVEKRSPLAWTVQSLTLPQTEVRGRGKALLKGKVVGEDQVLAVGSCFVLAPELGSARSLCCRGAEWEGWWGSQVC